MSQCGMLPSTVQAGRLSFVEHLIRTWIKTGSMPSLAYP